MKKRREERALERVQQEEELSMVARERAIAEGVELEAKEELVRPGSRGLRTRKAAAAGCKLAAGALLRTDEQRPGPLCLSLQVALEGQGSLVTCSTFKST